MKWVLISLAILVVLILVVVAIGYMLPVKHQASVEVTVPASPEQVWRRLTDFANYPAWRKSVKQVEVQAADRWVETNTHGERLPFRILQSQPPAKLVTLIDDKNLPYGGSWVFELRNAPNGPNDHNNPNATSVVITENGEVYNPIFRFVSKFILGHTATLKEYVSDLSASFTHK